MTLYDGQLKRQCPQTYLMELLGPIRERYRTVIDANEMHTKY